MKVMRKLAIVTCMLFAAESVCAEECPVDVEVGADLVSSYVWRGQYQTGISVQPTISVGAYGFSLSGWGSTDFSTAAKEVDFTLAYGIKGFTASVTDYWWEGQGVKYFGNSGSHFLEGAVSYSFGEKFPLTLGVATMFTGDDDLDADGKRNYSTYISADYAFKVKDIDCNVSIGVTPAAGLYADKFNVASINAKAAKELKITDSFKLPISVEAIFSPSRKDTFLVFGLSF